MIRTDLEIRTLVAKTLCPTAWALGDGHEYTTGAVAVMQSHAFKVADDVIRALEVEAGLVILPECPF